MITSFKVSTQSAGAVSSPPYTKANENLIPVLPLSTHPNFRDTNNKKRQPWKRNSSCIRCQKRLLEGPMYRRQLLLASTSLPLKPQQMLAAMPQPPNLTDYQKLANAVQEAEKLKNTSHGRQEISDVAGWLNRAESLKPPSCKSPDELSRILAVAPAPQESLRRGNEEKDVVTARVRRPEALKPIRFQHKEEQLVLQGIEVTNDKPLCFDVYIKFRQGDDDEEEELYAGTFCHMPPPPKQQRRHNAKPVCDGDRQEQKRARRCCLRLGMDDISTHQPLKTHEEESVTVKLVPTFKGNEYPIKMESIFIDYT